MAERKVSTCRSCGAEIRWVKTRKGKRMPVDDEPTSAGRFVIQDPDHDPPKVRWLRQDEEYTGDRFMCHFDTCPSRQEEGP